MACPHCAAPTTTQMARRTTHGYRMFRCRACRRTCNERTGTLFNQLQVGGVSPNPRNFRQAFPARELSGKEPIIGKIGGRPRGRQVGSTHRTAMCHPSKSGNFVGRSYPLN